MFTQYNDKFIPININISISFNVSNYRPQYLPFEPCLFFSIQQKLMCYTLTYNKSNTRNFPTLILSNKLNVTAKQQIPNSLRKPIYLSEHFPDIRTVLYRRMYRMKQQSQKTNDFVLCNIHNVLEYTKLFHLKASSTRLRVNFLPKKALLLFQFGYKLYFI